MVESIRPELDVEIGTTKKGPHGIRKRPMSTFNRSILMGSIRTSRKEFIPEGFEQINNIWVVKKFATLIDMNIFVSTIGAMLRKKMSEPFNRGSLRDPAVTVFHPSKMISDKDPTGLAMKTSIVNTSLGILRSDTSKGEVNRKALIRLSGNSRMVRTRGRLSLLSNSARRTCRKNI